jgi:gag-polypeptide of LTR copia-type
MSEEKLHLPKLADDGSNWITYRDRMQWVMKMRGLGDHLTSDSVTQAYHDAGEVAGLKPAQRWAKDQAKASWLMDATIPDTVFHKIKATVNVKEVWDQLKMEFEGKSRSTMVDLGRKFQTTRCGEDEDVRAHFAKLAYLREQLIALGRAVGDDEYAAVLMGSLPPSYDSPIDSLTSSCDVNDKDVTPKDVIRVATRDYDKRVLRNEVKAQDEAFAASSNDKDKKKGRKKDAECFNCKKKGHYKAECWAKGGGDEGGGPKKRRESDGKQGKADKQRTKEHKDSANAADTGASSEDESWAAIVEDDDAPGEGESCFLQSALIGSPTRTKSEAELYDSGASRHMSPYRHLFTNLRDIPPHPITVASNRVFYAIGVGDLKIEVPRGSGSSATCVTLKDTLYAPDMAFTVVSISRIAMAGCTINFEGKACKITNKRGKIVGEIPANANGLYWVSHPPAATESPVDIPTIENELSHASVDTTHSLIRANAVAEPHLIEPISPSPLTCDSCDYAKATRKAIRKESTTPLATAFGDEVHTDVWGPSQPSSLGGRKYYITFTDDHTRFTRIELLRTKDEALQAYKTFAAWART